MKIQKLTAAIMAALVIAGMTGCKKSGNTDDNSGKSTQYLNVSDMFTDRDKRADYDESECIKIKLNGAAAECGSKNVSIDNGTITIKEEGTYMLSGELTDGMIIIDADKKDKIQLVLDGVTVNKSTSAAIYVKQADKAFITLADGTQNTLSNSADFKAIDENNIDGVIFSKSDLTINGTGSLTINAVYGHGIVGKDDVVFAGGQYVVTTAKRGISANDSIRIADGSFTVTSGTDALHAENSDDAQLGYIYVADGSLKLDAGTDGLDSSSTIQIDGGTFDITSGEGSNNASTKGGSVNNDWGNWSRGDRGGFGRGPGGMRSPGTMGGTPASIAVSTALLDTNSESAASSTTSESASAKGIKADNAIVINGGEFNLDTSDDSMHSNNNVEINGGNISAKSGDDGIHADNTLDIIGGSIEIIKSYEGIEGLIVNISGGDTSVTASDDGINAAGGSDRSSIGDRPGQNSFASGSSALINISGGNVNVNASGDGIDSNGAITVSGGKICVSGSTNSGNAAFDYDGTATITGGTIIAAGASGMAQNFDKNTSTQCSMLVTVNAQSANTPVSLRDSNGKEIASYTPPKDYNCVLISCPDIYKGSSYTLTCGSDTTTVKMDSLIYGEGTGGFGGKGGGMHGMR